jgi:hypothetical protein
MSENGTHTHDGAGALGDQFDHLLAVTAWGDLLAEAERTVLRATAPVAQPAADPQAAGGPSGGEVAAPAIVDDLMRRTVEPLGEHDLLELWSGIPADQRTAPVPAPATPEPVYDPEDELHTGSVDGDRPTRPDLVPVREDVRLVLTGVVEELVAVRR